VTKEQKQNKPKARTKAESIGKAGTNANK